MRIILSFMLVFAAVSTMAQQQATVMSYNVLNYPTGNIAGREDTLRQLINYVEPDIFLIQELKNDSGLQLILNESFSDLPANYAASAFVPQQSSPFSNWKLQQAMIYNTDMFGMKEEGYLMTDVRDLNKFELYYKDPNLAQGADTVFFYVFVMHLKSSQGTSNVQARLAMVQTLTLHEQFLPADANMIVAGDFNVYTSDEPAYQELLDPTNSIILRDPIDSPGDWNSSSFQPKDILTQSTRTSSIFGDGAGGGLDDRFDFILLSNDMFQPWNTVVYEEGSYHALGNTGTCYNQNITDCSGGEWSDEILQSLYYMSDHLPIVLELNFGVGTVGLDQNEQFESNLWIENGTVHVNWPYSQGATFEITDMLGRNINTQQVELIKGQNLVSLPIYPSKSGLYIIRVFSKNHELNLKAKL
jgi:endonuclease/exonuclease/phosphatase family metal-dependent hydrolase